MGWTSELLYSQTLPMYQIIRWFEVSPFAGPTWLGLQIQLSLREIQKHHRSWASSPLETYYLGSPSCHHDLETTSSFFPSGKHWWQRSSAKRRIPLTPSWLMVLFGEVCKTRGMRRSTYQTPWECCEPQSQLDVKCWGRPSSGTWGWRPWEAPWPGDQTRTRLCNTNTMVQKRILRTRDKTDCLKDASLLLQWENKIREKSIIFGFAP